jgi:hypothetical protein
MPLAIKSEGGAGAAAKTVPTGKPLAKTQDLVSKSQRTDLTRSSILATANTKPPLIRGSTTSSVGDLSSIGFPLYHKKEDKEEITNGYLT